MFLHLLAPDRKFLPVLRRLFQTAAPGRHLWVVTGEPDQGLELPDGVRHVADRAGMQEVLAAAGPLEGVVLNGLAWGVAGELLRDLPRPVAVAWYVWGFEAYTHWSGLRKGVLLPETAAVVRELEAPAGPFRRGRTAARAVRRRARPGRGAARRLVSRFDFCVSPFREEYDLYVRAGLPGDVRFHEGLVGTLEDYADVDAPAGSWGEPAAVAIQVGNSAWPWNNHLDALTTVAASPGTGAVVVPLGYGDRRYAAVVAARGAALLGGRFHPLMDFLPPAEYLRVVHSCGHVVMDQLRQQALGNIFAALWRGARLHLNATTVYEGLTRMGFEVGRIPPRGATLELTPSSGRTALRHRALLEERFARATVIGETRALLDRMSGLTASRRGAGAGRGSS